MNLDKIADQTFYWIDENARRSAMALSQKLSRRNSFTSGYADHRRCRFSPASGKGPFLRAPFKRSAIRKVAITGAIVHSVGFVHLLRRQQYLLPTGLAALSDRLGRNLSQSRGRPRLSDVLQ